MLFTYYIIHNILCVQEKTKNPLLFSCNTQVLGLLHTYLSIYAVMYGWLLQNNKKFVISILDVASQLHSFLYCLHRLPLFLEANQESLAASSLLLTKLEMQLAGIQLRGEKFTRSPYGRQFQFCIDKRFLVKNILEFYDR